ncbi:DUF2834 domain-containing protein [Tunicatimonas pelagia]|uniref:DUF2834 domain-containing protein n=1 Tax=Tunicatimonas pelagia TaxID=931531 RepID=UPI0026670694|nr:DUF2834 domain-containing protein [Tunicatimonas pelagia]WKN45200.1 DUF2834 domain-containing protein [Tunicatimonas pelagia]
MRLLHFYLVATVLGTVLPYYQLFQFIAENGWGLMTFIEKLFINAASSMGAIDLLISSAVFWVFLYLEGSRVKMSKLWIYVLVNLFIGLSAALPLFLYVRERRLAARSMSAVIG